MTNKVCKNHKTKTYTGKENTPLGKGYHAEGEKVKKTMKGKDGSMYEVIKTKNGKRWKKLTKGNMKSPRRNKRGAFDTPEFFDTMRLPEETTGIVGKKADNNRITPDFVYGHKPWIPGSPLFIMKTDRAKKYCIVHTKPENLDKAYFTLGYQRTGYHLFEIVRSSPESSLWDVKFIGRTQKEI